MILPLKPPESENHPLSSNIPLQADDDIVRFVESDAWLLWGDDGRPKMEAVGIPARDLKGGGRAVSVTRLRDANRDFLSWRATARNKQPEWRDDPVYAIARVADLVDIVDRKGRRELKVYLEPVHDWLGPNENHASIVREPDNIARGGDKKTRDEVMTWQLLRVAIADAFSAIAHCSGLTIRQLDQK